MERLTFIEAVSNRGTALIGIDPFSNKHTYKEMFIQKGTLTGRRLLNRIITVLKLWIFLQVPEHRLRKLA